MSNSWRYLGLSLLLILGIVVWRYQLRKPEHSGTNPSEGVSAVSSASPSPTSSPSELSSEVGVDTQPAPVGTGLPALKDANPSLEEFREDVAKDPHQVPQSLRDFSAVMGAKMERAVLNERSAKELFPELEECVARGEVNSARQVCLVNSRRLGKKYPSLTEEASKVESAAPQELKDAVDSLGLD